MRERNRKLGQHNLSIRLWTLKDKARPMFRPKEPDQHCVELIANRPDNKGQVIVNSWWFNRPELATAQYNNLSELFS